MSELSKQKPEQLNEVKEELIGGGVSSTLRSAQNFLNDAIWLL
jgi:hypothetical protein